ncbi:endo alpha-1,4 polygalactosaminidase [Photobacterium rosenbergii]|uniref:Endo alpha-1,4 polygalactosaminidase n=1 Tax=Photobacterium rosenbergii TaxID=294936 RepID=A0ABU3ZBR7_9GAMM|nr:endo alpha-1,4 polygalactosaminidase [Photobacterium rosenbergii]MDV5167551.1 endo alpha-1,4 polygalactosaminidase [Photobacterium rosenbergii]
MDVIKRTLLILLLFVLPLCKVQASQSVAFYYNNIDSVRELINYDRVVVTPALITDKQISTLQKADSLVFAYLSIGEYDGKELPEKLQGLSPLINPNWSSHVMDLSTKEWQTYLIEQAAMLTKRGFDGIFLDTLDSYTLFAKSPAEAKKQQAALSQILEGLNALPKKPLLIFNRGFEVIDQLTFKPYALAAESMYNSYDPVTDSYQLVPESDRTWLTGKLNEVKKAGVEAIVIDYLPASDREAQKRAAKRLLDEGYTPYISDGLLYEFGVSTIEPIAKRVLGFYDSRFGRMITSECHRMMSMPIEYYGYVPECVDVRTTNLSDIDITRYAGFFFWLEEASYQQVPTLQSWIISLVGKSPVLFLNALPTNQTLLSKLGIALKGELSGDIAQQQGQSWTKQFYPASFSQFEKHSIWQPTQIGVNSEIAFGNRSESTTVLFKAPWGGAAISPFPVMSLANGRETWIIDPFRLINELFPLPPIPAADATTESGLRILTSHVDGDGFPSKAWFPGKPYTAEVLNDYVFKKYDIPQTVSVIEGEVGKRGLYPEQSDKMEAIARDIFRLPNIEIASHTFSHPFFWDFSANIQTKQYGDNLPIPNYAVDYHNEIVGSINYINKELAPENKKAELILWSGRADPTEEILAIAEQANVLNVNGGNTYVVRGNSNFTQVSPTIVWYPSAVQVYAPVLNENLYTNLWTEHHDGYSRAVETFEILGSPRRLKSISIYYHMYSGAYPASLNGLKKVYDWALIQDTTPLYLSEYAKRASALYETGVARTLDGQWQVTSTGIASVRLPESLGYPRGHQFAGWNAGPDGKFMILKQPKTRFTTANTPDNELQLKSSNGKLITWDVTENTIGWSVLSHVPLKMVIRGAKSCQSLSGVKLNTNKRGKGNIELSSSQKGLLEGTLKCQLL